MENTRINAEITTDEENLFLTIQDFFDCRKIGKHLLFLEFWMENALVNTSHKKYLNASDLLFFSTKFMNLLTACQGINMERLQAVIIPKSFIVTEHQALLNYPQTLRTKEICNPLMVLQSVFKDHDLAFYQLAIQDWVNKGLSNYYEPENTTLIFPTYISLKKLTEACWLIHERSISMNSYKNLPHNELNLAYALSCPLLLTDEQLSNPYLMIESFFSFAGINDYRSDLTIWFKAALHEQKCYENANDLIFIHNQFLQLLQAGYLIGSMGLTYLPESNYSPDHQTFGHWLLARMESDGQEVKSIQTLSPNFRDNPMDFCAETLTIAYITKIRYGLKEWLEAALSKNNSISSLDPAFIFDQFEDLQKILEALFLLIVQPAMAEESSSYAHLN